MNKRLFLSILLIFSIFTTTTFINVASAQQTPAPNAPQASTTIVISQIYGAGGNAGATYTNDFVEVHNVSASPQSLNGLSLQYGSATGQFGSSAANTFTFSNVTLQPGQYYLVQMAGGTIGAPLPTPDATGTLTMAAASGKVALTNGLAPNSCGATATPCALPNAQIIDLVAYGTSNNGEGGTMVGGGTALTATTAAVRNGSGCSDTDNNNADFTIAAPAPRNSATTAVVCSTGGNTAPAFTSAASATFSQGTAGTFTVSASGTPTPTIALTSGILPTGVTFTDNGNGTGTLAGTPSQTGTFNLTFTASNSVGSITQSFTLTVNAGAPTITASPTSLTNFGTVTVGSQSPSQSYTVSGSNLTANIIVTAPTHFQVSLDNVTFTSSVTVAQTNGSASAPVFVRFAPTSAGAKTGNVTNVSTGATTVNVAVSGTAQAAPLDLTITQSAPATVALGGTLTYTITIINTPAASLTTAFDVSFVLPASGYSSPGVNVTGCSSSAIGGNTVTLTGCTIGSTGILTATVTVVPTTTGTLTSGLATVDTGNTVTESNEANNTANGVTTTVNAAPTGIVINEVYGGGANSGATYNADYIELYNTGTATVDLSGYSLQYASATGTFTSVIALPGTSIAPGGFYLVQTQPAGATGAPLTPNFTSATTVNLSATAGNVLLAAGTAAVGTCPAAGAANVLDRVGFGATANCAETAPAPAGSNTTSIQRVPNGSDTNNNSVDFIAAAGSPGTANAAANTAPTITSASSTTFTQNVAGRFQVTATGNPAPTISTAGPLPSGVTLSSSGLLSGTPTQSGTFTFTITAANGTSPDATQTFTLTVTPAQTGTPQKPNVDFDGDGKSDYVVTRNVSDGANSTNQSKYWYISNNATNAFTSYSFGLDTDVNVPADYDGDGKADVAVWRAGAPFQAAFYIFQSSTNTVRIDYFGQTGDIPTVTADYDGDGKADPAIYRAGASAGQSGIFAYRGSLNNANNSITIVSWGTGPNARPYVGDFDGDKKADFCVNDTNNGSQQFLLLRNADNGVEFISWGLATDKLVSGDFDADGKSDFCVVRTDANNQLVWYALTRTGATRISSWGLGGDQLAPGDYDGDGRADFAVWRGSTGAFYILKSSDNGFLPYSWGTNGDTAAASWRTRP